MPLPAGLRALDHRDFRLFWLGQLVSLIGTWMQTTAQSWLVLELTGSPFKLGLLGTLQFAPFLLFSLVAGAITDRLPKRRLLLLTQTGLLVQAATLAALVGTGHVQYWHVALLAVLLGTVTTLDLPARQTFVVDMVGKESLINAIALNSAAFNGARVVGPAVAGLLVARYGVALAFLLNAGSFLAVLAALLAIRTEGVPHHRPRGTVRDDVRTGIRYALILSLVLGVSVFVINYNVLVPLLARDVLHGGPDTFGFLMAALGVGAVLGALAVATRGRPGSPLGVVVAPALVLSAATLSLGVVHRVWLAATVLFVIGIAQIVFMTSCNTILQITAPDELRGRVMSLYALVFAGVIPIGSFLIGSLAETLGVSAACLTGGGLGLVSVLALTTLWQRSAAARFPGLFRAQ